MFSSKELYMMNGGRKSFIGRDGFADSYRATAAEEAEWSAELVQVALERIEKETNSVVLQGAIDTLEYHQYAGLQTLLQQAMQQASPQRRIAFATALWRLYKDAHSVEVLKDMLQQHRPAILQDLFWALNDFKQHNGVRQWLVAMLLGEDEELANKAYQTIVYWSWSGMPELRVNDLAGQLNPANQRLPAYQEAVVQLKQLFGII